MPGSTATIQIDDQPIQLLFKKLIAAGGDLEEPLEEIREDMLAAHEHRWDLEVDPDGNEWEILSPLYEARKKKKRPGRGILVYDELMKLLNSTVRGDEMLIGSNKVYAATHQYGSKDGLIPARPFLGFSEEDVHEAQLILGDHLERLLSSQ